MPEVTQPLDKWATWLLETRFAGDPERAEAFRSELFAVRDRMLANARVKDGDTLLDVGAGDGLLAFGALPLVGEAGRIVFSDISQDLLDHSHALAEQMGTLDRVTFLRASADDLSAIHDASVDVVTTRSVLIYVERKREAFAEFCRVLRPGGRLSIFEPINRFSYPEPVTTYLGYDVTPVRVIAGKIKAVYCELQSESDPMLDFDEQDLLQHVEAVGFGEIHLAYEATIKPRDPMKWEHLLYSSGNPKIPTLDGAMRRALTPQERNRFIEHVRPQVEAGRGRSYGAVAYLWAIK